MADIIGTDDSDTRYGTPDKDNIYGLKGNDELYGGLGDDLIFAGPAYQSDSRTDNDRVFGDTSKGEASNDTIYGGYGDDVLYGDSLDGQGGGNDSLYGESGNDVLYGGDGADRLYGGSDDDIYANVDLSDVITENASEGNDTVTTYYSYTLGANLENLVLNGTSAINGTGNALKNVITGNDGANTLAGGLGDDTLSGGLSNDTLDGGEGNDSLTGDAGDDYLNGRVGADQMRGGVGTDKYVVDNVSDVVVENAGEGTDTVVSTINYTLGANVENLTLTESAANGTGNDLNNYMLGTAGNNVISGKAGDDLINGRGGNDVIVGGAGNDTLYGDLGADKFRFEFKTEGIDLIRDFNRTEGDKIEIIKSSFGATSLNQFSYNSSTGALFYDASASDNIGSVQLATLTNKPAGFSTQSDIILT